MDTELNEARATARLRGFRIGEMARYVQDVSVSLPNSIYIDMADMIYNRRHSMIRASMIEGFEQTSLSSWRYMAVLTGVLHDTRLGN